MKPVFAAMLITTLACGQALPAVAQPGTGANDPAFLQKQKAYEQALQAYKDPPPQYQPARVVYARRYGAGAYGGRDYAPPAPPPPSEVAPPKFAPAQRPAAAPYKNIPPLDSEPAPP